MWKYEEISKKVVYFFLMSIAPAVPSPPWAVRYAYARGTAGAIFLLPLPHSPAHLNAHTAALAAVTARAVRVQHTGRAP